MVYLFYTIKTIVDLAHHEIHRAKVGKGVIKCVNRQKGKIRLNVTLKPCMLEIVPVF